MSGKDIEESSKEIPLSGIPLARRFYEIAIEEYETGDTERMKDGCEKAYRAALEALDVLLAMKGYRIDIGTPEAHGQRGAALAELKKIDPKMRKIQQEYSTIIHVLHGLGFYTREDPRKFRQEILEVEGFIDTIEQVVTLS